MVSRIVTQKILNAFVQVSDHHSKDLIEKLKIMADGRIFDIFPYIEGCTIDIVCGMGIFRHYFKNRLIYDIYINTNLLLQ